MMNSIPSLSPRCSLPNRPLVRCSTVMANSTLNVAVSNTTCWLSCGGTVTGVVVGVVHARASSALKPKTMYRRSAAGIVEQ